MAQPITVTISARSASPTWPARPRADPPSGAPASLSLLDGFVACRTTLDDLQSRVAALGRQLTISDLAACLTGKTSSCAPIGQVVADAINGRLCELSVAACVPRHQHGW